MGKWLQGEGRTPKSWMTIIRVLTLNELAKDIEQTLETGNCIPIMVGSTHLPNNAHAQLSGRVICQSDAHAQLS